MAGYIDALYFTVATVTTTGFGDIVLPGPLGKLTSIVAMIIGITLFVRLAQALFRPSKVFYPVRIAGSSDMNRMPYIAKRAAVFWPFLTKVNEENRVGRLVSA